MKKWITENWVTAVLAIALIATVIATVIYLKWEGDRGTIRDIMLIIGGIALLWRAASQDKIAKANLQSNEQTIFKDSFESLAHPSESIRIGGIQNLHELAIENPERSKAVLEILCAHLRYKTTEKTKEEDYQKNYARKPSEEINLLLDLLISKDSKLRDAYKNYNGKECILNFRGAFLNGANLSDSELKGADLSEVQMSGVLLEEARMQGAYLWKAQMQGANLEEVQMHGARLAEVQMQGANLSKAIMQGANLQEVQMQGANLSEAQMQIAKLEKAQMQGAYLWKAQMQGADLEGVNLCGASDDKDEDKEFKPRMNARARQGKSTSIETVIFSGGLKEDLRNIKRELQEAKTHFESHFKRGYTCKWLKDRLGKLNKLDVDTELSCEIPNEAITGIWDEKEADKTIEEYEEAVPWKQDNDKDD